MGTRCVPLGRSNYNTSLIRNLRQSYGQGFVPDDGKFSALGISFNGQNIKEVGELNYSQKIEKVRNLIKIWSKRNMTIFGRLTLIKCFLMSQFVYLINLLPSSSKNKLLYKFLWGGGREKLKRDRLLVCRKKKEELK